jgi:hypothetical protein
LREILPHAEDIFQIGTVLKTFGSQDLDKEYCHSVAPSCKIELASFSALPKFQDRAECGNRIP